MSDKHYRNYPDLTELKYYADHVLAMTKEDLHSKSDIAAELAWRDERYSEVFDANVKLQQELEVIKAKTDEQVYQEIRELKAEGIREAVKSFNLEESGPDLAYPKDYLSGIIDIKIHMYKYASQLEKG